MDASAPLAQNSGEWKGRPAGLPGGVPPPSVPLSFLGAASFGLIACGVALLMTRTLAILDPTNDRVVGAAHFAMLATLSMGVLGALHQFTPVIAKKPLRSVRLSRATFVCWLAGSWLLPLGFITQQERVVEVGGGFAGLAVVFFVVNISRPLSGRRMGTPVTGLRLATIGFVVTACYGVVYVIDRREHWFDLSGHVVLAHASVGLLAWLGLAYFSVSEKLWPMFMLAHVPGRHHSTRVGIWALFAGTTLLSCGLLFGVVWLGVGAGLIVATGIGAHLFSLLTHVRHRRRASDLHLCFVIGSAIWLLVGTSLAVAGALATMGHHHVAVALVAASISALAGWLLVALVGHSYKIVPFIVWSALRGRGIERNTDGSPLMFGDLYNHSWSTFDFATVNAGVAATCLGFATSTSSLIGVGGGFLVLTGLITLLNLSWRPARILSTKVATNPATGVPTPITSNAALRQ